MPKVFEKLLSNGALAVLSGIIYALLFPSFNLEFLAWVFLIPLLYAVRRSESFKEAFLYGLISGAVSYSIILYWIVYTVRVYGGLSFYWAAFSLLLLAVYLALYFAFFAGFTRTLLIRYKKSGILLVPSCWVFFEFLKSTLLTGFPWENLGFSQYLNLYFIQASNIVGVFGISFVIVMVNYSVFRFIFMKKYMSMKQGLTELGIVSAAVVAVISYGYYNINYFNAVLKNKKPVKVALIQGNIGMLDKWNLTLKRTAGIYMKLTRAAVKSKPKLVIWPETAIPYILSINPRYRSLLMNFAVKNKIALLFGAIGTKVRDGKFRYYNRDFLFDPSGASYFYDKHHLVPFGEYIPLKHDFPFLAKILKGAGIGDFSPGRRFRMLRADPDGQNLKIGSMICYEAYFDSIVRRFPDRGANLLASITDDAWYGRSSAPYQDMSMTVFSAVENGRFVARAGNSGISGIISPTGKILSATPIFVRTYLTGYVKLINRRTFFSIYGNIFNYAASAIFLISIIYLAVKKYFKKPAG